MTSLAFIIYLCLLSSSFFEGLAASDYVDLWVFVAFSFCLLQKVLVHGYNRSFR